MITLSCNAGYDDGGLGRHFAQLVESARNRNELTAYYCPAPKSDDGLGRRIVTRSQRPLFRFTPLRFHSGWRMTAGDYLFDRAVSKVARNADTHVAFSGQALNTFKACGAARRELVSPTPHVNLLAHNYERAFRAYPFERPWLTETGRRKALLEYELATRIFVSSDHSLQSFLEAGVPAAKLFKTLLTLPPRFCPQPHTSLDIFRVVYVGSLTVAKGVPVLVDAFRQLPGEAELVLLGGWGSRSMRRYLERAMSADARIRTFVGDPLATLSTASVLVHPSYAEGYGYAPMEALACNVPVIVSEDTGMKEHVRPGVNGWVVPTGSVEALRFQLERLQTLCTGERFANLASPTTDG